MKKLLLLIILLSGLILSGCGDKEEKGVLISSLVSSEAFEKLQQTQDQRWEMLKEYLGVIEYTDKFDIDKYCSNGIGVKTYLTSDKYKVEWVELECDKHTLDEKVVDDSWDINHNRCFELKDLIDL